MPSYTFRCKDCKQEFTLSFPSISTYEQSTPTCPDCRSAHLSRLITSVSIPRSSHDYRRMSSNEMLSVLESGDAKQVETMFQQVGSRSPSSTIESHNALTQTSEDNQSD